MHRSGNHERSEDDHSVDLKRSVELLPSALRDPRSLELWNALHQMSVSDRHFTPLVWFLKRFY
jgi:hypothetical protein